MDACMARCKHIDTDPRLLAVDLSQQLMPGTFEQALNYLLDYQIDLSGLDARFCNAESGAPAYPPSDVAQADPVGAPLEARG